MKAVVDRIETNLAVLEIEGKIEFVLPLYLLPRGTKPGNILKIAISIDKKSEKKNMQNIKKIQTRLKKN